MKTRRETKTLTGNVSYIAKEEHFVIFQRFSNIFNYVNITDRFKQGLNKLNVKRTILKKAKLTL